MSAPPFHEPTLRRRAFAGYEPYRRDKYTHFYLFSEVIWNDIHPRKLKRHGQRLMEYAEMRMSRYELISRAAANCRPCDPTRYSRPEGPGRLP